MNCRQFESRIHELLDERRELSGDSLLTSHRRACPRCNRLLVDFQKLSSFFPDPLSNEGSLLGSSSEPAGGRAGNIRSWALEHGRVWIGLSIAAALLATLIPLVSPNRPESPTPVAASSPMAAPASNAVADWNEELPWPQVLATIEELPRHLESLGPVYLCTVQMTGVTSLTSPLNLTVDLLRLQLSREVPGKSGADDSRGRFQRAILSEQLA